MSSFCTDFQDLLDEANKNNLSTLRGPGISKPLEDDDQTSSDCSIVGSLSATMYNLSLAQKNDLPYSLMDHMHLSSNQHSFTNSNCAVYNPMDSVGCRFKFGNRSKKKNCKQNEVDIKEKLNELNKDKNPVAILNDILTLKKMTIEYETISMSGAVHTPIFTVRAKSDNIIAYGCGSSKKDAKRNAAIEFLKVLDCYNGQNDVITSTTSNEDSAEKVLEQQLEINPIGVLQEMCMSNCWLLPHYEYTEEVLNESIIVKYSVVCSLKIFKSSAEGKSKQSAKRQAARLLYDKIKCLTPEEKAVLSCNETPSKILLDNNQFNNNNLVKHGAIIPSVVLKFVEMFIDQLKLSNNPSINKLKSLCTTKELKNAVGVLNQIGEEEGFTSTYIKVESMNSNPEVLVQVATIPLLVNLGTGNTFDEAQEAAAYGALIYLKLLLEK